MRDATWEIVFKEVNGMGKERKEPKWQRSKSNHVTAYYAQ